MQSHLNELIAAVRVLSESDFVDSSRIVGLGNSEGALHVLHYATSAQDVPFVGIVLAAPPGRPIKSVLLSQLALQSAQVPGGAALMSKVEEAAARYAAGLPMDPDPGLRKLSSWMRSVGVIF
jgi:predicted esterase